MIFSLVSYVSINCIRFTGIISAQSTPTNNGVQSIYFVGEGQGDCNISTHGHPKVAARIYALALGLYSRFNTQPPEGGCHYKTTLTFERRIVSTHSHPKVAALIELLKLSVSRCFNTQPPEGGCPLSLTSPAQSTAFQHTAARRRLRKLQINLSLSLGFQHTAARRRLQNIYLVGFPYRFLVSTHSRPKAAAL